MRVAIVYDRVNKWGGAERVLLALNKLFPEAPLYTSVYDPKSAPWTKVFPKVITSFLDKIPFVRGSHQYFPFLMPFIFESFDFSQYDLVISVTSEAAKGIITKPGTKHICYCLTPTRYLWSGYEEYFKNPLLKIISKPYINFIRKWDKIASTRPDLFLANSQNVANRIKKYYQRDSVVIHSPIEDFFLESDGLKKKREDAYLVVSRLVPYKRIDLAIRVFNKLGYKLYVIGTGSEEKKLKKIAKDNIKFLGYLTDDNLRGYYEKCTALVFPQEEDFGLIPLEAQACGLPVIAYKKGGALETVIEGVTGTFFDQPTPKSLMAAVEEFKKMHFDKEKIKKNAQRFRQEQFKRQIGKIADTMKDNYVFLMF